MFLTKRQSCYFVVWTTKDTAVILISRDESWEPNLDIMKDFYFFHIFPKIIEFCIVVTDSTEHRIPK